MKGKQWKQKLAHDTSLKDRTFQEGDEVYAEDFSARTEKWVPGVVHKVTGPLSYHIRLSDGRIIRRHVDSVRTRSSGGSLAPQADEQNISPALQGLNLPQPEVTESTGTTPPSEASDEPQGPTTSTAPEDDPAPTIRRSNRNRAPPSYYGHNDNSNEHATS